MFSKDFASHFENMLNIKLSFKKYDYTSKIIYLRSRSQKQEIDLKCIFSHI